MRPKEQPDKRAVTNADAPNLCSTTGSVVVGTSDDITDRTRARAYEVYLARDPSAGDAEADWLIAEAEVRNGALKAA